MVCEDKGWKRRSGAEGRSFILDILNLKCDCDVQETVSGDNDARWSGTQERDLGWKERCS